MNKQCFLVSCLSLFLSFSVMAQQKIENVVVITTDGFRWQEVFKGMDSEIVINKAFNQGERKYLESTYGSDTPTVRRQKLLPFLWTTVEQHGQLYGNRSFDNKVDNANPYWISYPGYSEIFTGYPDKRVNSNGYKPNPNENVLAYINQQPGFKGKVAAFGAWEAFDKILNEQQSGFPVFSAFDSCGGKKPSTKDQLINAMLKNSYKPFGRSECLDVFTHYEAMEYLKEHKPRVLYIAYGETDEWAHEGRYKDYLDAAHQVDAWIKELWTYLQSDAHYRNKTALVVAVDHGRGDLKKDEWTDHGSNVSDAHQIWFAIMGPGLNTKGEVKTSMQLHQEQLAQTIASLLSLTFIADHPIAESIHEIKQ